LIAGSGAAGSKPHAVSCCIRISEANLDFQAVAAQSKGSRFVPVIVT
jgi:hypothetical protein